MYQVCIRRRIRECISYVLEMYQEMYQYYIRFGIRDYMIIVAGNVSVLTGTVPGMYQGTYQGCKRDIYCFGG